MGDFIYQCEAETANCLHPRSKDRYILKCPICGMDYNSKVNIELFVRAYDRNEAKSKVHDTYPNAVFFR